MKKFEGMILACDMDGTLLDDDRQISQGNQQALRYFTQEGDASVWRPDGHRRRSIRIFRKCHSMRRIACSMDR